MLGHGTGAFVRIPREKMTVSGRSTIPTATAMGPGTCSPHYRAPIKEHFLRWQVPCQNGLSCLSPDVTLCPRNGYDIISRGRRGEILYRLVWTAAPASTTCSIARQVMPVRSPFSGPILTVLPAASLTGGKFSSRILSRTPYKPAPFFHRWPETAQLHL